MCYKPNNRLSNNVKEKTIEKIKTLYKANQKMF